MIDKRSVLKSLRKKGFEREEHRHHIYLHHKVDGRLTGLYTYVSHGANEDLGDDILRSMRRQLGLATLQQVRDLVRCPMSGQEYTNILRSTGHDI